MNINPASPHGPRPAGSDQVETNRTAETRQPDPASTAAANQKREQIKADSADVSAEAKALAQGATERPKSTLSADRLKQIGERLADGHYDRPEVIDEVARRLAQESDFTNRG